MSILITDDLVTRLASGQSCEVGGCKLYPDDEDGIIWGCDPYGCDFVAADNWELGDIAGSLKAIKRAHEVDQGDNPHDHHYLNPYPAVSDFSVI